MVSGNRKRKHDDIDPPPLSPPSPPSHDDIDPPPLSPPSPPSPLPLPPSRHVTWYNYNIRKDDYITTELEIWSKNINDITGICGKDIKKIELESGVRIEIARNSLDPRIYISDNTNIVRFVGQTTSVHEAERLMNADIYKKNLTLPCTRQPPKLPSPILTPQPHVHHPQQQTSNCVNPVVGGIYAYQSYPPQPPTTTICLPPGPPLPQPGYGPGAYPGAPSLYNKTQQSHANYPQQQASGGGWDQTTAAQPTQQTGQGGYDYYCQQQFQRSHSLGQVYRNQPGPGYCSYGGYQASAPQSGCAQPQPGYDQQQGYGNPTQGYNAANQTSEGQTASYGAQGDNTSQAPARVQSSTQQFGYGQRPSSNPSFTPQGAAQPGNWGRPTSQAPALVQSSTPQFGYDKQHSFNPSFPPQGAAQPGNWGRPTSQAPALVQSSTPQFGYDKQLSSNPSFPPQGAAQPVYWVCPTSEPLYASYGPPVSQAAYAQQPQQSPAAAQGGYAQPAPVQAQPDYGAQQAPPSYGSGYPQQR